MQGRCRWEHFHHEADIGIRGIGSTPALAFAAAGQALTAVVTDLDNVLGARSVAICVEDEDREILFVRFLNAVVYEMSTRRMLFRDFDVQLAGHALSATLRGEAVDRARHRPAVEIKGATLTALRVAPCEEGWLAQCVVDV